MNKVYSPRKDAKRNSPTLRLEPSRVKVILLVIVLLFLALVGRAFYLQTVDHSFLKRQADVRFIREIVLPANRGVINDRNGEPLAISTPVKTLWAIPSEMQEPMPEQVSKLAAILDMDEKVLQAKFSDKAKDFVYIKRQISPEDAKKAMALGINGVFSQQEFKRYYPTGEMLSHVLGFTGVDGDGREGVELSKEAMLAGQNGSRTVLRDRRGFIVEDLTLVRKPNNGQSINLTIDRRVQYIAFKELKKAVLANKAKAGSVVVLDAKTGELYALANYPSFNPNNRQGTTLEMLRNRGVIDTFEAGSTMKPLSLSIALETKQATINTVLDTRPFKIGPATVRDVSPQTSLSILGIIQKSSNVGTSKLALKVPPETFWKFYDSFGFGHAPKLGFPGEASGRLRNWKSWKPIEQATMSFGYGVSVSLLQMARAYTVFANDGAVMPVSLYLDEGKVLGQRVLSEKVSRQMRETLVQNSLAGGGAMAARIIGYSVGGKSGTARKLEGGTYVANKHRALFLGFAPGHNPKFIVAVMIDEPTAGHYYGGTIAAPVFSAVASGSLRTLNIEPDEPLNTHLPIENNPVADDF